jgi:hypothetical protein
MIRGIQMALMGCYNTQEMIALLESDEAYLVARLDGVEQLRVRITSIPDMNPSEWFDLGPHKLPFNKTRFDCPAFIALRFKTQQEES